MLAIAILIQYSGSALRSIPADTTRLGIAVLAHIQGPLTLYTRDTTMSVIAKLGLHSRSYLQTIPADTTMSVIVTLILYSRSYLQPIPGAITGSAIAVLILYLRCTHTLYK